MTGPFDRLDSSNYGDPEEHRGGVAPPCVECGRREVVDRERDLCAECVDDLDDGEDEPVEGAIVVVENLDGERMLGLVVDGCVGTAEDVEAVEETSVYRYWGTTVDRVERVLRVRPAEVVPDADGYVARGDGYHYPESAVEAVVRTDDVEPDAET